jgi:uncharacterized protein (DUF1697 family)
MKYVALLRGINVGKGHRVEMKRLVGVFVSLGYVNPSTYINSGNVLFESDKKRTEIREEIEFSLKKEFGFDIPTLVKTEQEMQEIAKAVPNGWQNDSKQRSDVAYLFEEVDNEKIIEELPVKKEYIDIRYVKGAVLWNVDRENYNKSHLNKIISHKSYQSMTVRNVNTARFLAGFK